VVVKEEVVHTEDTVQLLVEHLVRPKLRRCPAYDACHVMSEKQRAIATMQRVSIANREACGFSFLRKC
jgi:hypothetical protein